MSGPLRSPFLPVAVLIAIVAIGGAGGAAAVTPPAQDADSFFMNGRGGWAVRWQARSTSQAGVFRLYRGRSLDSLRVVDTQQAVAGIGRYQFKDRADGSTSFLYQLRFVADDGNEFVLGTVRVDPGGIAGTPATGNDLRDGGVKALLNMRPSFALVIVGPAPADGACQPEALGPVPEVPPPRRAG